MMKSILILTLCGLVSGSISAQEAKKSRAEKGGVGSGGGGKTPMIECLEELTFRIRNGSLYSQHLLKSLRLCEVSEEKSQCVVDGFINQGHAFEDSLVSCEIIVPQIDE